MMEYRSFSKFRCIVIVFSLIVLIFQTGCWSKDEIEDLRTGLDKLSQRCDDIEREQKTHYALED